MAFLFLSLSAFSRLSKLLFSICLYSWGASTLEAVHLNSVFTSPQACVLVFISRCKTCFLVLAVLFSVGIDNSDQHYLVCKSNSILFVLSTYNKLPEHLSLAKDGKLRPLQN